jgi:nucleotide-binding universal stress UspA family protein
MNRHLLVTVSDNTNAMHAVRFVGHFFSDKKNVKVTLFYTASRPAAVYAGEKTDDTVQEMEAQSKKSLAKGRKALDAARKELLWMGFPPENVETKLQVRQFSKVEDIIQEGTKGLYDAVVLGRRGLSWLEETFDESVSKGLLEQGIGFPIWICRKPEPDRNGVLLCVDGSESAACMVDHVGFMLQPDPLHRVKIIAVVKGAANSADIVEKALASARDSILKAGVPAERIETQALEGSNVAKVILKVAKEERFAAVAVGRKGAGQGMFQKLFMGSVSMALFKDLEGAALWVCR